MREYYNFKNRVGLEGVNSQGCRMKIIEYFNCRNMTVEFMDYHSLKTGVIMSHFKTGELKNNHFPEVHGVGFLGSGNYKTHISKQKTPAYIKWKGILKRCYSVPTHAYKDVTVCEEWHNFQNFAQWFEENYKTEYMKGWYLDKDILSDDVKIYSPETCCFVPGEINTIIIQKKERAYLRTGVVKLQSGYKSYIFKNKKLEYSDKFDTEEEAFQYYKQVKKEHIKNTAEKYKDKLDQKVYNILIDFDVDKIIGKKLA